MYARSISIAGILIVFLLALPAMAAGKVSTDWGKAVSGYDPVAYFTEGMPVEGRSEYALEWNGATWLFASAENRGLFKSMPEKYAPQFGGYCAWAVSQGYTAQSDPEAWKIVDGKLYLNYSKSVQERWSKNIAGNIADGEKNWPGIEKGLDN